ncbi:helix-turn-helix domain-containing protein [Arthrobacter sp. CDRTa11]|uniref:helix-turn-helix domain-containing protein n=1 Tax=Arthrobacter sp. CDRTa11 TaxID=2651199 RepID=UPI0022659F4C|nr:XRE family transcriptional regulator [Arthrobacter sp. CDRTa11]UZX01273.1 helix-turn-helix domain-containing protein [Arthrobacter sp. CDRTa11]
MSAPAPEARSDAAIQLGMRLRDARQSTKLSIRELARRVDVSASLVSQIELGRTTPSVGTLYALVSALGLSLDALLQDAGHSPPARTSLRVVETPTVVEDGQPRSSEGAVRPLVPSTGNNELPGLLEAKDRPKLRVDGVLWERLTAENDPNVELLRVTYGSGTESCPPDNLMRHGGHEYFHILEGRLNVEAGSSAGTLKAGDSINFVSSAPHRLSNPFNEDCIAIWVVVGRRSHQQDNPVSPVA